MRHRVHNRHDRQSNDAFESFRNLEVARHYWGDAPEFEVTTDLAQSANLVFGTTYAEGVERKISRRKEAAIFAAARASVEQSVELRGYAV